MRHGLMRHDQSTVFAAGHFANAEEGLCEVLASPLFPEVSDYLIDS